MKAIAYPFRIDSSGKVANTTDPRKVWQDRVRAVLNTQLGGRVNRPELGIDSNSAVLNLGSPAATDFSTSVHQAFARFLPALSLNSVSIDLDDDSGVLTVEVVFTCPDRQIAQTTVGFDAGLVSNETDPYEVFTQ